MESTIERLFNVVNGVGREVITKSLKDDILRTLAESESYQEFYSYPTSCARDLKSGEILTKPEGLLRGSIIALFRTNSTEEVLDRQNCQLWGVTNKGTILRARITQYPTRDDGDKSIRKEYTFDLKCLCSCQAPASIKKCNYCWPSQEKAKPPLHHYMYCIMKAFDNVTMFEENPDKGCSTMYKIVNAVCELPLQRNTLHDVEVKHQMTTSKLAKLDAKAAELATKEAQLIARETALNERESEHEAQLMTNREIFKTKMEHVRSREAQFNHLNAVADLESLYTTFKQLIMEVPSYEWDPAVQRKIDAIESQLYASTYVVAKPTS